MLHQPCDLHLRDRFNRCNHNQFDLLRKRLRQARRRNNQHDRHNNHCDQRRQVHGRFRHRRVHRDRYRHRQLRVDQKVV